MTLINAPETVPEWHYDVGGPKLVRPTSYFRNAQEDMYRNEGKGRFGYLVKNRFGKVLPMTFLLAHRMEALLESGEIEIKDYLTSHYLPSTAALEGYDTEGASIVV